MILSTKTNVESPADEDILAALQARIGHKRLVDDLKSWIRQNVRPVVITVRMDQLRQVMLRLYYSSCIRSGVISGSIKDQLRQVN